MGLAEAGLYYDISGYHHPVPCLEVADTNCKEEEKLTRGVHITCVRKERQSYLYKINYNVVSMKICHLKLNSLNTEFHSRP